MRFAICKVIGDGRTRRTAYRPNIGGVRRFTSVPIRTPNGTPTESYTVVGVPDDQVGRLPPEAVLIPASLDETVQDSDQSKARALLQDEALDLKAHGSWRFALRDLMQRIEPLADETSLRIGTVEKPQLRIMPDVSPG